MWYDLILKAADFCFGWILLLPGDLPLVAVALLTSLGLVGVRLVSTNQELLRRARADRRRLQELIRDAKARRDTEAIRRHKQTLAQIALKRMGAEGKPLLAILIPIAFLATWCLERLDYLPPRAGDTLAVTFDEPASERDRLVHLVPVAGLLCEDGWIRRFEPEKDDPLAVAATWALKAQQAGDYELMFRYRDKTYVHPLRVGRRGFSPAVLRHPGDDLVVSSIDLRPRKLFGIVPGIPAIGFAPWLVGYLLLVIPLVFVNKALFRIE